MAAPDILKFFHLAAVLSRFLPIVGISIAILVVTGAWMFARAEVWPPGWDAMAAIGVVMILIAGHIAFAPYRRLKRAVAAEEWPAAASAATQVALLAKINLGLGTAAIAAAMLWH